MNGNLLVTLPSLILLLSGCGGGGGNDTDLTKPVSPPIIESTQFSSGGAISPVSASIASGQTTTFTVTAQEGFQLQHISGCSGTLNGTTYITGVVQQNCTVEASFAIKKYQVTVAANNGGKISPTNAEVAHGEQTQINISPDSGYTLGHVSGCGGTLTGNIYTTEKLSGNCQIQVNFTSQKWLVSTATNRHIYGARVGSIFPTEKLVSQHSITSFHIEPMPGFNIKNVDGCTGNLVRDGIRATFTTDPIRSACTAFVHFTRVPVAEGIVQRWVKLGNVMRLNAAPSSDPEGELLTYAWSLLKAPAGSQAKLEHADQVIVDFVPDLAGHYQFGLTVNDGSSNSYAVDYDSQVTSENIAPIAQITYSKMNTVGEKSTIDASQSYDIEGDEFQFKWTLLKQGSPILIVNDMNKLEWTPTETGSFMLQLRLTDSGGMVGGGNYILVVNEHKPIEVVPPTAKILFISEAATQKTVYLDARASTGETGETLTYQWSIVTKPEQSNIILQDSDSPFASFVPDVEGTYAFKVNVSNGTLSDDESIGILVRDTSIRLVYENAVENRLIDLLMPFWGPPIRRSIDEDNKTIEFGKYYLISKGKDYVLENVEATEYGNDAKAYFYGLHNGLVIPADTVVEFSPRASLAKGVLLEFQYKFQIKGTNKTVVLEDNFKLPQ